MAIYKTAGSKNWQIRFQLKGKTIRENAHTNSRKLAMQIEAGLRAMVARGQPRVPVVTFIEERFSKRP